MIDGSKHATLDLFDQDILAYEPFEGDRDSNVVVLSDQMVIVRKAHRCQVCWGFTEPGQRCRRRAEVDKDDSKRMSFYFCSPCCEAMAKCTSGEDQDEIYDRYMLHHPDKVPADE